MTGKSRMEVTNVIEPERLRQMEDNFRAETSDPASEEWREDLSAEEAGLVADWDERMDAGITKMVEDTVRLTKCHYAPYPLSPEMR